MTHRVIARRRREREAFVDTARRWAERAGPMLGAQAIVVVGSVARGDFNKWSDIDVLVVVDGVADDLPGRLALLGRTGKPPGLEAVVWTGAELAERRAWHTDPIVGDAYGVGVVVYGRLPD
ncbi:MAG TPA: nucleotidyltransferase domain-containing protein [Acidimicrobiales bacterium]|nr:nucleotidyltransferase domain-containing protein [Acidimicrobiales bacterium]